MDIKQILPSLAPNKGFRAKPINRTPSESYSVGFPYSLTKLLEEISLSKKVFSNSKEVSYLGKITNHPRILQFCENYPGVQNSLYEVHFLLISHSDSVKRELKELCKLLEKAVIAYAHSDELSFSKDHPLSVICTNHDLFVIPNRNIMRDVELTFRELENLDPMEFQSAADHTRFLNIDFSCRTYAEASKYGFTILAADVLVDPIESKLSLAHETGHHELFDNFPLESDLVKRPSGNLSAKKHTSIYDYDTHPGTLLEETYTHLIETRLAIKMLLLGSTHLYKGIQKNIKFIQESLKLLNSSKAKGTLTPDGKKLLREMQIAFNETRECFRKEVRMKAA